MTPVCVHKRICVRISQWHTFGSSGTRRRFAQRIGLQYGNNRAQHTRVRHYTTPRTSGCTVIDTVGGLFCFRTLLCLCERMLRRGGQSVTAVECTRVRSGTVEYLGRGRFRRSVRSDLQRAELFLQVGDLARDCLEFLKKVALPRPPNQIDNGRVTTLSLHGTRLSTTACALPWPRSRLTCSSITLLRMLSISRTPLATSARRVSVSSSSSVICSDQAGPC